MQVLERTAPKFEPADHCLAKHDSASRHVAMCPDPMHELYARHGCRVNDISAGELFSRYEALGFLYPKKRLLLEPYYDLVLANWDLLVKAGEPLARVITYDDPVTGSWGTVTTWMTTPHGALTQHLTATGSPLASRAPTLCNLDAVQTDNGCIAVQCWFNPGKRLPNKLFGTFEAHGTERCGVYPCRLLHVDRKSLPQRSQDSGYLARPVRSDEVPELAAYAARARGPVYARAEELSSADVEMTALDDFYRSAGLFRYRRAYVVLDPAGDNIVGAALAYRGPLGLNFSFLENRCDLLMDPALPPTAARNVASALMHEAAKAYQDCELDFIPVTTDIPTAQFLEQMGAARVTNYSQTIWTGDGIAAGTQHIERCYDRVISRLEERRNSHAAGNRGVAQ